MSIRSIVLAVSVGLTCGECAWTATYHAAPHGDDSNAGTSEWPWRSIQRAADVLQPGDTAVVHEGRYDERVFTVRSGMGEASRISFRAQGRVVMKGWQIDHAYITVEAFEITGLSGPSTASSHVEVTRDGDNFKLLDCTVRDGIQGVRNDMIFRSATRSITSQAGGFIDAGFAPGQTLYVGAGAGGLTVVNRGSYSVVSVTDNEIVVAGDLADEGPLAVYLSASFVYGLRFATQSESSVIRGNVFSNLGFDAWFIMGRGHLLEDNIVERVNGWDAMHFGGSDLIFHRNVFRNSPLMVYQVSPDAWENYSPVPYSGVVFTNNVIEGFDGVLSSQKGSGQSDGLLITRNLFIDVGRLNLTHPGTTIEQNTFLRVARQSNPVLSVARHPIRINSEVGATNMVIRNNIFVDCGQASRGTPLDRVGWYEIGGPEDTVVAEGNFVAGPPPLYAAKSEWPEANPLMNGGDPGFVNIDDPLGPDGIPFTEDDGLRLRPDSKLRGAGVGGVDIGAYVTVEAVPVLEWVDSGDGKLSLSWMDSERVWYLESAMGPSGPWATGGTTPVEGEAGRWAVVIETADQAGFYRLAR